jgi:hypothetical protein
MTTKEWLLLGAFVAAVYGISFVSPDAAMIVGGLAAVVVLVNSGALDRLTKNIGG